MNATSKSLPAEIDEFEHAELKKIDCNLIECPRVVGAPAALECKLVEIIQLPGAANFAVFGEVIGVHMHDDYVIDGKFDVSKFNPLTRLGYRDYSVVREIFSISRPDD
jgi:flavin reductase (DIM6/NTAB) family NADH-FMN oxidoreductase RutF